RKSVASCVRSPIEQMLRLVLPDYIGSRRSYQPHAFIEQVPGFFGYLQEERGLRPATLDQYDFYLRSLQTYLRDVGVSSLEGSVATLQSRRDRLARCSFWILRFAVYSNGVNLGRRSFCWRSGGTCAFPFRTATSRSCSPSGACAPITSQSGGGSSATPRNWSGDCANGSRQPTTLGGGGGRLSGAKARGGVYSARWG